MYMTEENFQYLEELTKYYDEEQRKRYKSIMFEILKKQGCHDLSVLMVMCKEAVIHMRFEDVITKRMIKRVHKVVTHDRADSSPMAAGRYSFSRGLKWNALQGPYTELKDH